jgi:hypothetical protein
MLHLSHHGGTIVRSSNAGHVADEILAAMASRFSLSPPIGTSRYLGDGIEPY